MIIVFSLLSQSEATKSFRGLKKWFADNPRKRICHTDLGKVRRSHMEEDFLKFCRPNVKLKK